MKKLGRLFTVLAVLAIAGVFLYPTVKWYLFVPQSAKDLALGSNVQIRDTARGMATGALEEIKALVRENPEGEIPSEYRFLKKLSEDSYKAMGRKAPGDWNMKALCAGFRNEMAMFETLETYYRDQMLSLKKLSGRVLQLGLDLRGGMSILLDADVSSYEEKHDVTLSQAEVTSLVTQDIEILKNRIDQFGVSEPDIRLQGQDQILIEIPGASDPERVNTFLNGKGSLLFHLVDKGLSDRVNAYFAQNPTQIYTKTGAIRQPDFLPEDRIVAGYYTVDDYGIDVLESFVVIEKEPGLDGSHLERAETGSDSLTGQPVVTFQLDAEGGRIFYDLTSQHIGDALSVVMDGKVKSVATISSAISNSVQISGFSREQAEELAVVLRTAALPIELTVASQQSVGATLGEDAVKAGLYAILIGFVLVVVFMFAYYGVSGLVADLALLLNLVIMLAALSGFGFTLTLTSIAGLILTLGMAVDTNVIIYERIKEEIRDGKTHQEAVKEGFSKAFWTVMDANITTIIAALTLSQLGSSAVKGFANTLAIGIVSSLFTALFVSHLIFDAAVTDREGSRIHISWRKI